MSIRVSYGSSLTILETREDAFVSPADNTTTISGLDTQATLDGTTTPAVTKYAAFQQALTAGAATIDLADMPGDNPGDSVDGTGLKARFVKFRAPEDNAAAITLTAGASNGYDLLGADWSLALAPGEEATHRLLTTPPTVAGGAKEIDLAGTGTDVLDCEIILG